jgi:hypothetical protein
MKWDFLIICWNNIVLIALGIVILLFFIATLTIGVNTVSFFALVIMMGFT